MELKIPTGWRNSSEDLRQRCCRVQNSVVSSISLPRVIVRNDRRLWHIARFVCKMYSPEITTTSWNHAACFVHIISSSLFVLMCYWSRPIWPIGPASPLSSPLSRYSRMIKEGEVPNSGKSFKVRIMGAWERRYARGGHGRHGHRRSRPRRRFCWRRGLSRRKTSLP